MYIAFSSRQNQLHIKEDDPNDGISKARSRIGHSEHSTIESLMKRYIVLEILRFQTY